MKIAVISDIHGNMDALEAVMDDIQKENCEKIFALGDYAMAGPEPDCVVQWFFAKQMNHNYVMIQGNTDVMLGNYSEQIYEELKQNAPIMAEALKSDNMLINPIQKTFLKTLPTQLEIEEEGVKMLLVHGSPRKNNEDILPDLKLSVVEEIIEGTNANIILCGHTHIPCGYQTTKKQTVVNVGSVGRPFTSDPKACYLKLTLNKGEYILEHKFVKYNKERAAMKLRKRNFVGSDKLADTLLDPKTRHF